jgi:hypothetical protein
MLVKSQKEWRAALSKSIEEAIKQGDLPKSLEPGQVAFEAVGIALAYQMAAKLLEDSSARRRALRAFDRLLQG